MTGREYCLVFGMFAVKRDRLVPPSEEWSLKSGAPDAPVRSTHASLARFRMLKTHLLSNGHNISTHFWKRHATWAGDLSRSTGPHQDPTETLDGDHRFTVPPGGRAKDTTRADSQRPCRLFPAFSSICPNRRRGRLLLWLQPEHDRQRSCSCSQPLAR